MLIWLASFPRSGNTLLRTMLKRSFGIETWSLYDDSLDIGADGRMSKAVGHRLHNRTRDEFVEWASQTDDLVLAKTHQLPTDNRKAIYVVRDGRAAIVSFYHYWGRVLNVPCTLEEVLFGTTWPGPWCKHVEAWALSKRAETLVVRYEDLVSADEATFRAIAEFIGRSFAVVEAVPFEEMQELNPQFFHRGSDEENIAELEASFPGFYSLIHGPTAKMLGYPSPEVIKYSHPLKQEYAKLARPVCLG